MATSSSPSSYIVATIPYLWFACPYSNMRRGQMGVSLLVNPDFPYPVTHVPSVSPYALSCQFASTLIHCVYLPPTASFSDSDALAVLHDLLLHSSPFQKTNTSISGDLNACHARLLGGIKTTTRGTLLYDWLLDTGLYCWNASFDFGDPTHVQQRRRRVTNHDASLLPSVSASVVGGSGAVTLSSSDSFGAGGAGVSLGVAVSGVTGGSDPALLSADSADYSDLSLTCSLVPMTS
ncbi:unnamed protein product [Mucor circinelloides]